MALTSVFTFGGMDNVSDPASVGQPDPSSRTKTYDACTDIVNCDVESAGDLSRREGGTVITAGDVTSAWGNGADTYCVVNGLLYHLEGDLLAVVGNSPSLGDEVEFEQVNDVIAFSDNSTIGYIKDNVPYVVNSPAETTDILDLETWVKLTYPAGADADESNLELDAFKLATFAGRCLTFFNGALYLAVDNFIFCTRTFNMASMDIRYNVVAGFRGAITMLKPVNDGLFVGTEDGVYFLAGDGVKGSGEGVRGFRQTKVLPFGVIHGSSVKLAAEKAVDLGVDKGAVIWLTTNGVYAGSDGGRCKDLSKDRFAVPAATSSAAMIREVAGLWRYVVSVDGGAIAVNLETFAHSRYTNFDYCGFFTLGGHYYGAGEGGVVLLEGETDPADVPVDAYWVTPVADFGVDSQKTCQDGHLRMRGAGALQLTLYVDEKQAATGLTLIDRGQEGEGMRQIRAVLPLGVIGNNYKFKFSNSAGGRFTARSFKVTVNPSRRMS
jgi:hypothetical protein